MKIGIFTDTYLPDVNGVVTSVVNLKKTLEDHGHEVYIVTNHDDVLKTVYKDKILRLPGLKLDFLYGYKLTNPIQISAAKPIKEWNLDIVHVHQEFGVSIFGRAIASAFDIPLVNTYHTTYEDYTHYVNFFHSDTFDTITKKAVEGLSKTFTSKSNIVIAPSAKTKEMLERYGIDKEIRIIPTGLDLARFDVNMSSEEIISDIRKENNVKEKDTTFVYVGRIAKEKSVDVIIDAFKYIKEKKLLAKLIIVGAGPDLDNLKEKTNKLELNDYISFTGLKKSEEVPAYYHASDAFISASTTETQGLTYIEALASGLGIFARKDEVLVDIVIENKTGFYFEDAKELALKMEYFINNKDLKTKIFNEAIKVSKNYSLEVYYERIIKCYEDAIEIYEHENNKID